MLRIADSQSRPSAGGDAVPYQLLAAGYLILLAVTWRLWIPQTEFPQIPLIAVFGRLPKWAECGLLAILVSSLSTLLIVRRSSIRRTACLLIGLGSLGLVLIDQHRLQPWTWQFIILSFVLATADAWTIRATWRWLAIGIYAWSAWSKLDHGFSVEHGRFLLDGFCKSIGLTQGTRLWSESVRNSAASAIPVVELIIATGLIWERTRFGALIAATLMHFALLFALGPFGHRHQPGVLIWNVFFILQNWFLFFYAAQVQFTSKSEKATFNRTARVGNRFACFIVSIAMLWPSVESFGLCDHWPAWAVYAAKPERVTVFVRADELAKLPDGLKRFAELQRSEDDWVPFRIDRWSLDSVFVPIYPQDRYQVGVALGLADWFKLSTIRIIIEGPANRWTGYRSTEDYIGIESINALADSYRCGARPRSS